MLLDGTALAGTVSFQRTRPCPPAQADDLGRAPVWCLRLARAAAKRLHVAYGPAGEAKGSPSGLTQGARSPAHRGVRRPWRSVGDRLWKPAARPDRPCPPPASVPPPARVALPAPARLCSPRAGAFLASMALVLGNLARARIASGIHLRWSVGDPVLGASEAVTSQSSLLLRRRAVGPPLRPGLPGMCVPLPTGNRSDSWRSALRSGVWTLWCGQWCVVRLGRSNDAGATAQLPVLTLTSSSR